MIFVAYKLRLNLFFFAKKIRDASKLRKTNDYHIVNILVVIFKIWKNQGYLGILSNIEQKTKEKSLKH